MFSLWVEMRGSSNPGEASNGSRLATKQTLSSEYPSLCCACACMRDAYVLPVDFLHVSASHLSFLVHVIAFVFPLLFPLFLCCFCFMLSLELL